MKTPYNKILLLSLPLLLLLSCKKDEERAVLNTEAAAPTIASTSSAVVLDSTNNNQPAVTFSWNALEPGFPAAVTYTLQFDTPADSFKNATNVIVGANTLSKAFSVQDFNALAYQTLGLTPGVANDVAVRLKADVLQSSGAASSIPSFYSNVYPMTVNPYRIIVVYPLLYVPGSYQMWEPATAKTLASVKANNVYEGYINFTEPTTSFKLTPAPNWNTAYGDPSGTSGTLSTTGGNLQVTGPGYYLLKADLNANTWSATKTTWSVIGDATPGGWNTDTPLTYDPVHDVWTGTVNLSGSGGLKFRANNAWDINLGIDNRGNLAYGANNIPVPATGSGTYTITLDLSTPGNYSYKLKKV